MSDDRNATRTVRLTYRGRRDGAPASGVGEVTYVGMFALASAAEQAAASWRADGTYLWDAEVIAVADLPPDTLIAVPGRRKAERRRWRSARG